MKTKMFAALAAVALLAVAGGVWAYARGKARADPGDQSGAARAGAIPCCDSVCPECAVKVKAAAKADACCVDCCPECIACCAMDGGCWECYLCCLEMGCDPLCCFPGLAGANAKATGKGKAQQAGGKGRSLKPTGKASDCCADGCCE
jgi:hypothetical protein